MASNTTLIVFGDKVPRQLKTDRFDTVFADKSLRYSLDRHGSRFVNINTLVDIPSIYEAAKFQDELTRASFSNGNRVPKEFAYKGFELWWIHYDSMFRNLCIPYTRYRRLLEHLESYSHVTIYNSQHRNLFENYLKVRGITVTICNCSDRGRLWPTPGIVLQLLFTIISLPVMVVLRQRILVFIGDKFDKDKDHDFRMGLIYEELRGRKLSFVEFIRSLDSWHVTLTHFFVRMRPVVYSEAIVFVGGILALFTGGRRKMKGELEKLTRVVDTYERFKILMSSEYLHHFYDDVWAIRIMCGILGLSGVRKAFVTAAMDRNFHTVLALKLRRVPIVGIMHGVSSRFGTPYDYMTGFDGKSMSVDSYGVWSEWWRENYLKNSDVYKPEQLVVSGPMRPVLGKSVSQESGRLTRVLFVSEQTVDPEEAMPYLTKLLSLSNIDLTIKFRPFRDGFEDWLKENHPEILNSSKVKIVRGSMQEAINNTDVALGCHSTGVLEALLQLKVPVFLNSHKWGDYYGLADEPGREILFARDPDALPNKIEQAKSVPVQILNDMRVQYFGNPHKDGSKWVVDRLEDLG